MQMCVRVSSSRVWGKGAPTCAWCREKREHCMLRWGQLASILRPEHAEVNKASHYQVAGREGAVLIEDHAKVKSISICWTPSSVIHEGKAKQSVLAWTNFEPKQTLHSPHDTKNQQQVLEARLPGASFWHTMLLMLAHRVGHAATYGEPILCA
eukprot:1057602-Pelagomonas_calceolata.AAC.1